MGRTSAAWYRYTRPATRSASIRVVATPSGRERSRKHPRRAANFPGTDSKRSLDPNQGDAEIRDSFRTKRRPPQGAGGQVPEGAASVIGVRLKAALKAKSPAGALHSEEGPSSL